MPPSLPEQLRELGLLRGDTVMVHTSMRAVGGRAEALIDALQETVGSEGALLVLICHDESAPFDAEASPAWDELGVLPEVFRTRPGVVVNDHPVARFAAWGREARSLIAEPPLHDYYGFGSPLARLVERRGKVLRLGADEDTVTLFHHAEYVARLADKRRVTHEVDVATPDGARTLRISGLDDEHGIAEYDGPDYFIVLLRAFLETGRVPIGRVGGARAECLDAAEAVAFAAAWMEQCLAP